MPSCVLRFYEALMWDDAKQLNRLASALAIMVAVASALAVVLWLVGQPVFAFRDVRMT